MITSLATRLAGNILSRARGGRRLVVLAYHRVFPETDVLYPDIPDARLFAAQMRVLSNGFNVIRLSDAIVALKNGSLPPRAVAVTFDDGYADNFQVAFPILKNLGLTATFFVASGYLDGGCMFNDKIIEACRLAPAGVWDTGLASIGKIDMVENNRFATVKQLVLKLKYLDQQQRNDQASQLLGNLGGTVGPQIMMESGQVKQLHQFGMEIGAHTMTHPILARLDDDQAAQEINEGRSSLEALIGSDITMFAYPNGKPETDYTRRDVRIIEKSGFSGAVSTVWGCASPTTDIYQIPRISPWDRTEARFTLRLLRAFSQTISE